MRSLNDTFHTFWIKNKIKKKKFVTHLQEIHIRLDPGQFVHLSQIFYHLCSPLLQVGLDALCLNESLSLLPFQHLRCSFSGLLYGGLQPGKLLFNYNTSILH